MTKLANNPPGSTPVVVAGLALPGLSLLRSFTRRGIPAIGMDSNTSLIGFHTRYGRKIVCPDPQDRPDAWLEFALDLGRRLGTRAVLIPTSDRYVLPIDRCARELGDHFVFAHPPGELHTKLTNKRDTFSLASQIGFPIPETCFPDGESDVREFIQSARFPCLIKPELSKTWERAGQQSRLRDRKVLVAQTADELMDCYREVVEIDHRVIVQEVIPGPDGNLVYFVCYLSRDQEMLGAFAGRKERITPIHFGSASYVRAVYDPELEERCHNFLRLLGYWGLCGVEVKYDPRDGVAKLVEVNPRYGLWDEIGQYIGVDIAYIAYRDLLGLPVAPARAPQPNYRWVSLERDARAYFEYRREGLDLRSWITSLRGPILWSDVSLRDLPMTWHTARGLLFGILRRLWRRIVPGRSRPESRPGVRAGTGV